MYTDIFYVIIYINVRYDHNMIRKTYNTYIYDTMIQYVVG